MLILLLILLKALELEPNICVVTDFQRIQNIFPLAHWHHSFIVSTTLIC